MKSALKRREAILAKLADKKWHNTKELNRESVGGGRFSARIREMRQEGYVIDRRRASQSVFFEYRLVSKPKLVS